jgi:vacuolar-type H+-ATPase subunit I/STV1
MNFLFQAHSGLRYLVLLAGLVALVYFASGLAMKRPVGKPVRILGAIFTGLLDLQAVLGLAMVALGRFYPQLIGHLAMMLLAVGSTHTLLVINRKRPNPGYALPLIAVLVALVLIAGGIMAIGRGVFTHTPS